MFRDTLASAITGFRMIFLSFDAIKRQYVLFAFAALSPLWTMLMTPVLFNLFTTYNPLPIPDFAYTFVFSFVGMIGLNLIYFSLVIYHLRIFDGAPASLREALYMSLNKKFLIITWALIGAIVGTALGSLSDLFRHSVWYAPALFKAGEVLWWLIAFLAIPVLAHGNHTVLQALAWTARAMISHTALVMSAGVGLLVAKYALGQWLFNIMIHVPKLLAQLNLITISMTDVSYLFLVLIPITGIMVSACISAITSATEATLATGVYARIIGRPAREIEQGDYWKIIFVVLLLFIVFSLLALSITTATTLLSYRVPGFKAALISLLS